MHTAKDAGAAVLEHAQLEQRFAGFLIASTGELQAGEKIFGRLISPAVAVRFVGFYPVRPPKEITQQIVCLHISRAQSHKLVRYHVACLDVVAEIGYKHFYRCSTIDLWSSSKAVPTANETAARLLLSAFFCLFLI